MSWVLVDQREVAGGRDPFSPGIALNPELRQGHGDGEGEGRKVIGMEQQPVWAWGFGRRRQDGTQFPHVRIEDTMVDFFFTKLGSQPPKGILWKLNSQCL